MDISFSNPVVAIPALMGGLAALFYGAEYLVAGASSMALRVGVTALVVGLTVVAFGTSAPELLVSLLAVYEGSDGISVGNIIGSNIANIALILGCAAMVRPLEVDAGVMRREYPLMLAACAMLVGLSYDGVISRVDGGLFLVCMAGFLGWSLKRALGGRKVDAAEADEEIPDELAEIDPEASSNARDMMRVAVGILGLSVGAYLLVESATAQARVLGISDVVIGITVVAVGTSLPELATSVVAAYRGNSDISVGNVVGSNIFNVWIVLGLVAVILPIKITDPNVLRVDMWVMLAVAIIIWPLMNTGLRISRAEGALLTAGYVAYTIYLFMRPGSPVAAAAAAVTG